MREINGTQCGKTTHATQFFLTKFQVFKKKIDFTELFREIVIRVISIPEHAV